MTQSHGRLNTVEPLEVPAARLPARAGVSAFVSSPIHEKSVQLGSIEAPLQALFKNWGKPAAGVVSLMACLWIHSQPITPAYGALAVVWLLVSHQLFKPYVLRPPKALAPLMNRAARVIAEWSAASVLLVSLGLAFRVEHLVSEHLIGDWFALTLAALLSGELLLRPLAVRSGSAAHRHVIVGANEVGLELARRVADSGATGSFLGFFDFRRLDRLPPQSRDRFAGACKDLAEFVQRHAVNAIYIALPMTNAPRIEGLLHEVRDTTASIYFVPDMFAFDLVQGRCLEMNGIAMVSVCDTPFHGMEAIKKRTLDLALSSVVLLLSWPVLVAAAIAVKLSSPGPVLFKQRRYGLHGEEILVYKFRSMTVCEDGPVVEQAKPRDKRITPIGRVLRRTSLDELPQILNVLQGTMSFVGPRPHAVVHNEIYRKLISGYMIRHKVRPGITGWAQVHGLRGETATVEQMRLRAEFDLDYVRDWSLWLDLKILVKTALIVIHGLNAR